MRRVRGEFGSVFQAPEAGVEDPSPGSAGKPDLFHAFQATPLPVLPLAPGLAVAAGDGLAEPERVSRQVQRRVGVSRPAGRPTALHA
jgi:hypothetical protein